MRLSSLLGPLTDEVRVISKHGSDDPEIVRVVHDSRTVEPGDLFCCIRGARHDGHDHVEKAKAAGAVAVLVEQPVVCQLPSVLVASVRATMPYLASEIAGNPSHHLKVVGVTGTNGKTSVTSMLADVLQLIGWESRTIGTLSGERTTPEAPEFQRSLAGWVTEGVDCVAAEISSHALDQHRVDATHFAAVAFTNLGRDHLDYHVTMESYALAKGRLFNPSFTDRAVVVTDGEAGKRQAELAVVAGLDVVEVSASGLECVVGRQLVEVPWRGYQLKVSTGGRFAVVNALVVAELATLLGGDPTGVAEALGKVSAIPGRFEKVEVSGDLDVVVDYAHTPDALTGLLESCRETNPNRLILVFGCGGERDQGKRPLMGTAAEAGADVVVVTSDNPRGEPPEEVIADILTGMKRPPSQIEPDRRKAIRFGLAMANPGDLVVLAGRGHETIQEIEGKGLPFDDRVVAAEEARTLDLEGSSG